MNVSKYVSVYACVCEDMHACVYVCEYICIRMCVCVFVCLGFADFLITFLSMYNLHQHLKFKKN